MNRVRFSIVIAVAAAGMTGLAHPPAATELRLAHFMSTKHVMHDAVLAPLAEEVAAASDGALTVRIDPDGELGTVPQRQYMRAVDGIAEITFGLQGYTSTRFPKTMLIQLPGIAATAAAATEMLWNAYQEHLADEYRGVRMLGIWTNEPNVLMTRDTPIRSLDDLAGRVIGVPGGLMAKTVEALGATPVALPAPEMYDALATGLVDGLLVEPCTIAAFEIGEVANHFTVGLPLGMTPFFLVMNQAAWDGLGDAGKKVLRGLTGREFSIEAAYVNDACGERGVEAMREARNKEVIELSEVEAARLSKVLDQVRERVMDEAESKGIPARQILAAMKTGS